MGGTYLVMMILCRNYQASKLKYTYGILLKIFGGEYRWVGLVMAGLPSDEIGHFSITD